MSSGLVCAPTSAGSTRCGYCRDRNATCDARIPASVRRPLVALLRCSDRVAHEGGDDVELGRLQRAFNGALRRHRTIGRAEAAATPAVLPYAAYLDGIASALENLVDGIA